jgi:hypothetical protein
VCGGADGRLDGELKLDASFASPLNSPVEALVLCCAGRKAASATAATAATAATTATLASVEALAGRRRLAEVFFVAGDVVLTALISVCLAAQASSALPAFGYGQRLAELGGGLGSHSGGQ